MYIGRHTPRNFMDATNPSNRLKQAPIGNGVSGSTKWLVGTRLQFHLDGHKSQSLQAYTEYHHVSNIEHRRSHINITHLA
jgi:hypothetical protein